MKFLLQLLVSLGLAVAVFYFFDWLYRPASIPGKTSAFSSMIEWCQRGDLIAIAGFFLLWMVCLLAIRRLVGADRLN